MLQQNANAAAVAAAAAVYQQWDIMLQNKGRSESGGLSGLNITHSHSCLSASMDDFKNMSASRISSEHERELVSRLFLVAARTSCNHPV